MSVLIVLPEWMSRNYSTVTLGKVFRPHAVENLDVLYKDKVDALAESRCVVDCGDNVGV